MTHTLLICGIAIACSCWMTDLEKMLTACMAMHMLLAMFSASEMYFFRHCSWHPFAHAAQDLTHAQSDGGKCIPSDFDFWFGHSQLQRVACFRKVCPCQMGCAQPILPRLATKVLGALCSCQKHIFTAHERQEPATFVFRIQSGPAPELSLQYLPTISLSRHAGTGSRSDAGRS